MPAVLVAFLALVVLIVGCGTDPKADTVLVEGDTTSVASRAPADWQEPLEASIDLVIGGPEASDEYIFGRLDPIAVASNGGVIVYDQMYNRISSFGSDGSFTGFIGSGGQGPGEYNAVVDLAVSPTGNVVAQLYDGRILTYSDDGTYLSEWRTDRRLAMGRSLTFGADSALVLKLRGPPSGFVRVSPSGEVVDSLRMPPTPWDDEIGRGQSDITPSRFSVWSPADFGVTAIGSRLAFQLVEPSGAVHRVERAHDPVPFLSAERLDWETQNEFLRRRAGDPDRFPPVPESKPVIRGVFTPPSGEIWVQVSTESLGPDPGHVEYVAGLRATPEWLEPLRMEVFTRNGDYLGSVGGPAGLDVRVVDDGVIWGYRNGELGEQHIVRLRVEGPP